MLLPALAAEVVPGLDLAPTWTASVLLITAPQKRIWIALAWVGLAALIVFAVLRMRHVL